MCSDSSKMLVLGQNWTTRLVNILTRCRQTDVLKPLAAVMEGPEGAMAPAAPTGELGDTVNEGEPEVMEVES